YGLAPFVLPFHAMLAEASLLVALTVQHGRGAEACLPQPKLQQNVEKRLRRRVFTEPTRAQLRFSVTYEARGKETQARIDVSDADGTLRGTRTLVTSGHCSSLDDSLALSVALLVDEPPESEPAPELAPDPAPATSSGAPQPQPQPQPQRPTPRAITIPAEVAAPREPWHVAVGASFQGAWGLVPGVVPGFSLYARILPRQVVPIMLSGEAFARSTAERDEGSGARFRLLRVGLSLCPWLWRDPERSVSWCFGQKIGWLRADGFGFDHDLSERRLNYALEVGAEARQRLFSIVSLRAAFAAEVPVLRDRFVSSGRNSAELFRASPVAFAAQIGLEAALW
ncbi:MAG: hypothetical protein K0R38_5977, partial [Polyangiaceae bacterium]|nr:hypothetical protein [Polyangiaceae bacterium]